MAGNPQIPLGYLNRLATSVKFTNFPALNVTPSFLGKRSVQLARTGRVVENLPALVGIVPSGEPYVMMEVHINLLKSQPLAQAFEQQLVAQATLGDTTVYTDVDANLGQGTVLQTFLINRVSIITVDQLSFAGDTPDYMVTLEGAYPVNQNLWLS